MMGVNVGSAPTSPARPLPLAPAAGLAPIGTPTTGSGSGSGAGSGAWRDVILQSRQQQPGQQAVAAAAPGRPAAELGSQHTSFLNVVVQCLWHCADFRGQVGRGGAGQGGVGWGTLGPLCGGRKRALCIFMACTRTGCSQRGP